MTFEEGDIILCTVTDTVGTVVHVKIENSNVEGSIVFSEIAPGRIRNLRDYVVPNKKIVCKVLRVSQTGSVDLSLRRVTTKERKEVLEEHQKEQTAKSILKSILKDKTEKVINEFKEKNEKILDFLNKIKLDTKLGEKYFTKSELEKLLPILNKQKTRKIEIKKEIIFTTDAPNGLTIIKRILDIKNRDIKYISGGHYLLSVETENVKEAQKIIQEAIETIEHG
ncbi:MAG: hypothetical protein AABY22_16240, partial [Nanoarchaeota archaeon]